MSGIVLDLQKEALDNNCDILNLLRKAYLIAKKLKLAEFEEWINNELNGYTDKKIIPEYRKVHGDLRGWNPYHGWIPAIIYDNDMYNLLSIQKMPDAISNLKNIFDTSENHTIILQFNGYINNQLSNFCEFATKFALVIGTNQIFDIIEKVRNIILDWSIKLETSGIIGEGLQFSNEEKEIAANTPIINNYINNFYGNVQDTQIQQNTDDSTQSQC